MSAPRVLVCGVSGPARRYVCDALLLHPRRSIVLARERLLGIPAVILYVAGPPSLGDRRLDELLWHASHDDRVEIRRVDDPASWEPSREQIAEALRGAAT